MEIRLLGPVELLSARGPVPIGSAKQRALLAFLALQPHRLVTHDALIDSLWGPDPPDGTVKALRFHVSRLRRLLRQAEAPDALRTRPGGYLLAVAEDAVDVLRFEKAIAGARLARSEGAAPDAVSRAFRDALELWVGPALADINGEPFVVGERRRLEELRLVATEDYFAAELAGGRHAEVVGELERMVDRQPLRERLWELLITALYRSGRQADALAAYQRLRRALADELGIEPSAPLRQLEHKVLLQDAGLAAPSTSPRPVYHSNDDEPATAAADEGPRPAEAKVRPPRGLATTALAFGILALGLFWLDVVSTLIAVVAVACGAIAVSRASTVGRPGDRRAAVGIITGAVAFSTSLGLLFYRHVTVDSETAAGPDVSSEEPSTTSRPHLPAPIEGREVPIGTVQVGDCLNLVAGVDETALGDGPGYSVQVGQAGYAPATVLLVPCQGPHEQEVYHLFELTAGPYPGELEVETRALAQCFTQFDKYVGVDPIGSQHEFFYVWPGRDVWESGNRQVGCSLFDSAGGDLTGSMAGSMR